MASKTAHASYDDIPYDGGIVVGSHPEHLATIGRLFGMAPAPVQHCRVLEIGCATGANLLPMAYSLPHAEFTGIDPSRRQIELGMKMLAEYGVSNVELVVADIRDALAWQREFDYIVCHGVLTWVAPEVQDAILAACRRLLAPNGIAYLSYNALPGFHMRAAIGEMLRYHARNFQDPGERIDQGRAILNFLVTASGSASGGDETLNVYNSMLQREKAILDGAPRSYLMHEHLVDDSSALYLHEFVDFAKSHALQYIGDAAFATMLVRDLPDDVAEEINRIAPDQVSLEQYRDFVVNRMFRKSLVCRDDVTLERHISTDVIASLLFRGRLVRNRDGQWQINKFGGAVVAVTDAGVTALLDVLEEAAPATLDFSELARRVGDRDASAAEQLPAILLSLYSLDGVDFRTWAPTVAATVSVKPEAFLPARKSARAGMSSVPVPYHNTIALDAFVCRMLPLVDGSRDHAELTTAMEAMAASGALTVPGAAEGEAMERDVVARLVGQALEQLRRAGLLVS